MTAATVHGIDVIGGCETGERRELHHGIDRHVIDRHVIGGNLTLEEQIADVPRSSASPPFPAPWTPLNMSWQNQ